MLGSFFRFAGSILLLSLDVVVAVGAVVGRLIDKGCTLFVLRSGVIGLCLLVMLLWEMLVVLECLGTNR